MFRHVLICLALLSIVFAATPLSAEEISATPNQVLSALLTQLATRPGVTQEQDLRMVARAARSAAPVFCASVGNRQYIAFTGRLSPVLQAYEQEYAAAAAGIDGAEARAVAVDRLASGILGAAADTGISPRALDMALLSAAAAMEAALPAPPLVPALTSESRELVDLLLFGSVQLLRQHLWLRDFDNALATLAKPAVVDEYRQRMTWIDGALLAQARNLEQFLADPANLADAGAFTMQQNNLLAIRDLFLAKRSMDNYMLPSNPDLALLIARMDALGGVMAGMTLERLQQSGLVTDPNNGTSLGYLTLPNYVAWIWVRPWKPLSYLPVDGLADELSALGGEVPPPPDFSYFDDPYASLIQFTYDIHLCNLIAVKVASKAEDGMMTLYSRPLSMQERLVLRQADEARRQQALVQFTGAGPQVKLALLALMTGGFAGL